MIKQLSILFLLQMKNKNSEKIPMIPEIFKYLVIHMMIWPLMEIFWSTNN